MQNKPHIGINADYRPAQGQQPAFSCVAAGYYDKLIQAGAVPVVLPPLDCEDDIASALDRLDGFLLTGGADLDPTNDGFLMHPAVKPMHPRRERFDRTLCRAICSRRMPVLAIGVGLQLLNVTLGGNLFLHIPDDLPNALPHRDAQDPAHRHGLVVQRGSLMDRVYGEGEIRVSSRHHMALDEVAPELKVTARSGDGVVEAVESNVPDWFIVGTQFHPENSASSALDARIFEEFVDAVRDHAAPVQLRLVG